MSVIIYYHANCPDGLTAAAVTQEFVRKQLSVGEPICVPISYGITPYLPSDMVTVPEHIYFVDFCPNLEQAHAILDHFGRHIPVTIIDHHISQKEMGHQLEKARSNISFIFDNEESGASLAYKHFYGASDDDLPKVVADVRDIDLWHWERPDSYGFSTLIGQKNDISFVTDLLVDEFYLEMLPTAKALSEFHWDIARKQARAAMPAKVTIFQGEQVAWQSQGPIPVLATDGMTSSLAINQAILCHQDVTQMDIGIGFYTSLDTDSQTYKVKLSVRSNGEYSTLEATQPIGGGGHRNASGAVAKRIDVMADQGVVSIYT